MARDAAASDLGIEIVRELLSEANGPAHDEAREHLEAASGLCEDILEA